MNPLKFTFIYTF